jgi:hypothetical protein
MTNRKFPLDTLHLVLAYKWYDMIESGVKLEEYRKVCPHWEDRIWSFRYDLKKVVFQRGYKKNAPQMTFRIKYLRLNQLYIYPSMHKRFCNKELKDKPVPITEEQKKWGYPKAACLIIRLGERIYTTASNGTTAHMDKERR